MITRFPEFDPDRLSTWVDTEGSEETATKEREERLGRLFVRFPYLVGMLVARECKMPLLGVLLELMRRSYGRHGQNPVKLPNTDLGKSGGSRRSKWRALRRLEKLKVISIEYRKKKSPLITLNWLPAKRFDEK